MKTPRPYQEDNARYFATSEGSLDGSYMGTGKTLTAVELLRHLPDHGSAPRVLVVAPVNTHEQWAALFAEQYPELEGSEYLRVVGTPFKDPESWRMLLAKEPGIYIIGWEVMRGKLPDERLRRELLKLKKPTREQVREAAAKVYASPTPQELQAVAEFMTREQVRAVVERLRDEAARRGGRRKEDEPTKEKLLEAIRWHMVPDWPRTGTWDLVIADEVHRLVNRSGQTLKVMKLIKARHRHATSGTPAGNAIEGIWSVAHWLWPQQFASFWRWADVWLTTQNRIISREGDTVRMITGEIAPGATWSSLPCAVRVRLEDVAGQLPEVIEREVLVPMAPRQEKIYRDLEEQAFTWLESAPLATPLPIGQRLRMRQAALAELDGRWDEDEEKLDVFLVENAPNPKIDALEEILADLPPDEPLLVFTHSSKFARIVAKRLGTQARVWDGQVTQPQRLKLKAGLGTEYRVLVAQIAAIGEGTDGLQHLCRCEVWLSQSEDGVMNEQAENRLHRPGQKTPVQRWMIRSDGTLDIDVNHQLLLNGAQLAVFYQDTAA